MKYITTLLSLIIVIGCSTTQSNIQVDSIETFNLDNYNDFNIKINTSNISAEINPIVLENFREDLKGAISTGRPSPINNGPITFVSPRVFINL